MEKTFTLEVTMISNEFVRPSSPTPSHLRDLTLSYVDQIVPLPPLFPTCGIVFYKPTPETKQLDIVTLKATLSETLTKFYPIAGRVTQSMIICNDEGVPFVETRVNSPISLVLNSPRKLDLMTKFLPPHELLGIHEGEQVTELTHLAIQVNIFTCGGVAIAWYDIHKVMDGMSSASFFKHWAALAGGQLGDGIDLVHPDFESSVAVFPPSPNYKPLMSFSGLKDCDLGPPPVVKRFIFRDDRIGKLKARAESEKVPKPSRFMTVAGFIWEQAFQASQYAVMSKMDDELKDTVLQVTLDMRSRTNPPLRKSTMGNLATIAVARADKQARLPSFVAEIKESISNQNDEIKKYEGDRRVEGIRENWNKLMEISSVYKDKAYKLVSWCRLGFNELDFGFGIPELIVPTDGRISPLQRNVIILNDYSGEDGVGIEAWLFLEEKEMKILESNGEFLAFASPILL